ncbi:hypothetical protein PYCC9005_004840 [Savitreella phatthalungensis]
MPMSHEDVAWCALRTDWCDAAPICGDELVLIDGDAVLKRCFQDDSLAKDGFQILHVTYLVETLLHDLRAMNYAIAFFNDRQVTSCGNDVKLRLARCCIVKHLQVNTDLQVLRFESLHSDACADWLNVNRPLFLATTDGAESDSQARCRSFILHALSLGMSVILLDDLEFIDDKLFLFTKIGHGLATVAEALDISGLRIEDVPVISAGDGRRTAIVSALHGLDAPASLVRAAALSLACTESLDLRTRHAPSTTDFWSSEAVSVFLDRFCARLLFIIEGDMLSDSLELADLFDGRLFAYLALNPAVDLPADVRVRNEEILRAIGQLGAQDVPLVGAIKAVHAPESAAGPLLPFDDPVWDKHIGMALPTAKRGAANDKIDFGLLPKIDSAIGMEKKLLEKEKGPVLTGNAREDAWIKKRFQRNKDLQMLHIKKAAESLTGANGVGLERMPIIAGTISLPPSAIPSPASSRAATPAPEDKDSKKKEKKTKLSKAQQIIAANNEAKAGKKAAKSTSAWASTKAEIDGYKDLRVRVSELERYLNSAARANRDPNVQLEMELYRVQLLLSVWRKICKDKTTKTEPENLRVVVQLFECINTLYRGKYLTHNAKEALDSVLIVLGLDDCVHEKSNLPTKEISFDFDLPTSKACRLPFTSTEFQLLHCGQNMERNMDSKPDPRTTFEADKWQRDVLDVIDRDESVFVVAPTSAGKTFISFYAMEKILRADDDGILVFIAPTKALVNQMAAEIEARFSKNYKTQGGKNVWAIHSGDYKIHDPERCQVLVTVPSVLQKLLMSPIQAQRWSPRIRRIVFDEIHCIGGEEGTTWEQLLLLAPCPIIALSATVGNPEDFRRWLEATQAAHRTPVTLIHHKERYSDLRKFVYLPAISNEQEFLGGRCISDELQGGIFNVHPASALHFGPRKMPDDLGFEPRDCYNLFFQMKKTQTANFAVPEELDPNSYFKDTHFIRRADVAIYQRRLRELLGEWLADPQSRNPDSAFMRLMSSLDNGVRGKASALVDRWDALNQQRIDKGLDARPILQEAILPMLEDLDQNDLLPALCFNYSRSVVESLGKHLYEVLESREEAFRATDPAWKRKIKTYEQWVNDADKRHKERERALKKKKGNEKSDRDDENKLLAGEETQEEFGWQDVFDPTAPLPDYSFAGLKNTYGDQDMKDEISRLESRNACPLWMLRLLRRGIGIHHSGLNRRYRQLVELAFRGKYLRVVICTGTLALGINMPATSSIFVGDNVELNALNFRQAAGRAGRRGYDVLGHVGFLGVPTDKIDRLLVSRIPKISGRFPISATVVLRLCNLVSQSGRAPFARRAIESVFARAEDLVNAMGEVQADDHQIKLQLRFLLDYLRRENLLGANGEPLRLAAPVSHLYYEEPSNLAFAALMRAGVLHDICRDFANTAKRGEICRKIVLLLAHLFCRISVRPDVLAWTREMYPRVANTIVLPPITSAHHLAQEVLDSHERRICDVFANQIRHTGPPTLEKLPISRRAFGGDKKGEYSSRDDVLSAFDSSSTAVPSSIRPFLRNARGDILLEDLSLRMHVPNTRKLTNAYIYDFYCAAEANVAGQQALQSIIDVDGIPRAESWFLLQNFSLVLASLEESMANILGLADMGEFDIMADADTEMSAFDEEEADVVTSTSTKAGIMNPTSSNVSLQDDWLELDGSEDSDSDSAYGTATTGSQTSFVLRDTKRVYRTIQLIRARFNEKWKSTWS